MNQKELTERVSGRIRSNMWAIAISLVAVMVTAAPASANERPSATASASGKKQVKKLKQKVTALEGTLAALQTRIAALEARPGATNPTLPTSLPPSGAAGGDLSGSYPSPTIAPGAVTGGALGKVLDNSITNADLAASAQFNGATAGGELAGTYPNPTIGTVSGLNLVSSDLPNAGINFGADVGLYRSFPSVLKTDGAFVAGAGLQSLAGLSVFGSSSLGNESTDETHVLGWLNIRQVSSAQAASDCDFFQEIGRMVYRTDTNELWICDDAGWLQILAS